MGYLLLDTRFPGAAAAYWGDGARVEAWLEDASSKDVLACLRARLPDLRRGLTGVALVPGPGRFSSIRLGVLHAHVLARWFRVPLFAVPPEAVATAQAREACFRALAAGEVPARSYVPPVYDREPNITTPRV